MEINFSKQSNNDISFIDLHRYINYIIFQKQYNNIDVETQDFINKLENNFYDLNSLKNFSIDKLNEHKIELEQKFLTQYNELIEQHKKLNLIKEILDIDLNYFNKQLKNIKNILKNQNLKISIDIINQKIINNISLNEEETQNIIFYNKLVNQKNYLENIVLSNVKKIINKKDIIKKNLLDNMKQIQKNTSVYFEQQNLKNNINNQQIINNFNDNELKNMLQKLDDMTFNDNDDNFLLYKVVNNLKKLTNKSHYEVSIIIKDNKFKQKIFGNLNIDIVNQKINEINEKLNHYNVINTFIKRSKELIYVCPLCNYNNTRHIASLLHMSEHENDMIYKDPIEFNIFFYNNNKYSSFSNKIIDNQDDFIYNMKVMMLNDNDIINKVFSNPKMIGTRFSGEFKNEKIDNISQDNLFIPKLDNFINKYNNKNSIVEYKNIIISKLSIYGKLFNMKNEITNIINEETDKLFKLNKKLNNFTKTTRIINFRVFKIIISNFFNDDDLTNFYNVIINYYDDNLKITENKTFDLLFKNIIHYNNKQPIQKIYQSVKKLFKIIKNIKTKNYSNIFYIQKNKKQMDPEAQSYIDYNAMIIINSLLNNRNFSSNIFDLVMKDSDDEKLDDINITTWVNKKDYKKLINKISDIQPNDFIINKNGGQLEDIEEDFTRLNEIFKNININFINKLEKKYDHIFYIYNKLIKNNMFLNDINIITSNKNINDKYNEYLNSSFLYITMKTFNSIINNNENNVENTKYIIENFFDTLKIYLNEDSKYLSINKNIIFTKKKIIKNNDNNNKDDLLNDFFESDDEDQQDDDDLMNELFGDDDDDLDDDENLFDDEEDLLNDEE